MKFSEPMLSFQPSPHRVWFASTEGKWSVHITGWAFAGDVFLSDQSLAQHIITQLDGTLPFCDILDNLNGNFAVAIAGDGSAYIGVDAVRSIPLLYRQDGNKLLVSDDIRLIRRDSDSVDPDSLIEYATAGYITGPHTLFSEITGLQSGECISWHAIEGRWQTHRYYKYLCSYDTDASIGELCEKLDEGVIAAFQRIIRTLNGRQVVIPLSGGLDSRLVAATLRRLGYDNVLCFSYGLPDNRESMRSRTIAKALGYRWIQTFYSTDLLKAAIYSSEMRDYRAFAANDVSCPHHDDWAAVRILRGHPEVLDDAIFMPGHTGDFISGSHLKYVFDPVWHNDPYAFYEAMIKKHYSLWEDLIAIDYIREAIERRLNEVLGAFSRYTSGDLACMYEYWEWQERQAKYIINAVRAYEFFGFSWRIPLWDRAIMHFWRRIPIALKMDKYLYRTYLASHDPMGVFQEDAPTELWRRERVLEQLEQHRRNIRHRLKGLLRSLPLISDIFYHYQKSRKHLNELRSHPLGFARAYGAPRYIFLEPSKRHALSLLVKDFLRDQYGAKLSDLHCGKAKVGIVGRKKN